MGTGKMRATQCLYEEVTDDVWDLLDAVEFADHGTLPVSGGLLDQAQVFLDGLKLTRRMTRICEARYVK